MCRHIAIAPGDSTTNVEALHSHRREIEIKRSMVNQTRIKTCSCNKGVGTGLHCAYIHGAHWIWLRSNSNTLRAITRIPQVALYCS